MKCFPLLLSQILLAIVVIVISTVVTQRYLWSDEPNNAKEYVDLLTLDVEYLETLNPYNVVLIATTQLTGRDVDQGTKQPLSESFRGRLLLDEKLQRLQWFCETRQVDSDESPSYRFFDTSGGTTRVWHLNSNTSFSLRFDNFDEAVTSNKIPRPRSWGLVQYPVNRPLAIELFEMRSQILSEDSKVSINESDGKLEFVARIDHGSPEKFDLYKHTFSSPGMRPLKHSFSRALNGHPFPHFTNEITWGSFDGVEVPQFLFFSNNRLIKREGDKRFDLGSTDFDVELIWSSVKQPIKFFEGKPSLQAVKNMIAGKEVEPQ